MRIYTSSMTNTQFVEHDITFKKDNHRENPKITSSHCSAACNPDRSRIIRLAASYLPCRSVGTNHKWPKSGREGGFITLSEFET